MEPKVESNQNRWNESMEEDEEDELWSHLPSSEEDKALRDDCMGQIESMSRYDFLVAILSDTLPDFQRAYPADSDYKHIFRDTNHKGVDYLCAHRGRLRQIDASDYFDGSFFPFESEARRRLFRRDLAMELIEGMTREEYLERFHLRTLPKFDRAGVGEADYALLRRSPKIDDKEDYLFYYRHRLRDLTEDELFSSGCAFLD